MDPSGEWVLDSVDGRAVPCSLSHEGAELIVREGALALLADGTGTSRVAFVVPGGREAVREVRAAWAREGAVLTLRWEGAGVTTGTLDGPTFRMDNEGMVFAYRRRAASAAAPGSPR